MPQREIIIARPWICGSTAMNQLEPFEQFYYGFQTQGRGLLTKGSLEQAFERRRTQYDELLSGYLADRKSDAILDVACGYGNFLFYLRAEGFSDIVGVDMDPGQIKLAMLLGLPAVLGTAEEYLREGRPYGVISAFDFIEHLDKNAAVKFVKDAYLNLSPGGMLIIQCPCADGFCGAHDIFNDLTHRRVATSNSLRQFLNAAGFRKVELIDLSLPPFPRGLRSNLKRRMRVFARSALRGLLRLLGAPSPSIWSNSQIAVAWKPV